ncbi:hypothetical protein KQX54_003199 [Cotesia glomerata]|uniref:Uncharacterized protein n=1 Tax=Cotesia glomerata TaxID=32391 RepID=A0AAV7IZ31_COTGL|nr:hypothetical protein KQX54_003199 [Cotesia glomerata]
MDENSKEFLINQRSDERIGFIANIKTRYDDDDNDNELNKKFSLKNKKKSEEEEALLDIPLETKLKIVAKVHTGREKIPIDAIPEDDQDYTSEKFSVKRFQSKSINDLLHNDIDFL